MTATNNPFKKDFPIFNRKINGKPLYYLDSAATSQKPKAVIDAISEYYSNFNANTHRGIYKLSEESTNVLEGARESISKFIGSPIDGIAFTKGATESINALAYTSELKKSDEIVTSITEHHSNFVPLQELAKRTGARLKFVDIDDETFELKDPSDLITAKTKIVSITGMSNVLGRENDIRMFSDLAHDKGATMIVDGAQLTAHRKVDMNRLGCDFLAMSSHKMLGPAGVGVLAGPSLGERKPFLHGGGMITQVSKEKSSWAKDHSRFEAGTPNLGGVAGFGAAIAYLKKVGMDTVASTEKELSKYAKEKLSQLGGVKMYGDNSIMSFILDGIHPHDIASILDTENVCIRAGHHCTMPLMTRLDVVAMARASFHIYNTKEDIDMLIQGLKKSKEVFN